MDEQRSSTEALYPCVGWLVLASPALSQCLVHSLWGCHLRPIPARTHDLPASCPLLVKVTGDSARQSVHLRPCYVANPTVEFPTFYDCLQDRALYGSASSRSSISSMLRILFRNEWLVGYEIHAVFLLKGRVA